MDPKNEEPDRSPDKMSELVRNIRKEWQEDKEASDTFFKASINLLNAFQNLGEDNHMEFLKIREDYEKNFLRCLQQMKNKHSQLAFVYKEIQSLGLKINGFKASRHERYQSVYENILHEIVEPVKNHLIEIIRREKDIGAPEQEGSPAFRAPEVTIEETQEPVGENKPVPIKIPVNIKDAALITKTGMPLHNASYIAKLRRFKWRDDRIPDLVGTYLLEREIIFDYQLEVVQEFLRSGKSNEKIVIDGKANFVTTLFFELKSNARLFIANNFLAGLIEQVFVCKNDTLCPLISKDSVLADLKPGSHLRRIKKEADNFPDILGYLEQQGL